MERLNLNARLSGSDQLKCYSWHYMSRQENEDMLMFKTFNSDSNSVGRCKLIGSVNLPKLLS